MEVGPAILAVQRTFRRMIPEQVVTRLSLLHPLEPPIQVVAVVVGQPASPVREVCEIGLQDVVRGVPPAASTCLRQADRKSTRLNSSHLGISYAVFCLKK